MEQFILGTIVGAVVTVVVCLLIKRSSSSLNECKLETEQLKSRIARLSTENESLKGEIDRQKRYLRSEREKYDILRDKHDVVLAENLKLKKLISKNTI